MLNDLEWPPLEERRKKRRLTTFYKASNNLIPVDIPEYILPATCQGRRTHSRTFIEVQNSSDQYKYSFLPRTIRDWNVLPPDLVLAPSADEFVSRLQGHTP